MGDSPRNSQGMARDAIKVALEEGVEFAPSNQPRRFVAYTDEQQLTALCIVHAGRGAEQTLSRHDIWSVQWELDKAEPVGVDKKAEPVGVGKAIEVIRFMTVPEDCLVGVCAHEWGHLAARWDDYYDTGKFAVSNGLGNFCLMASGSYGNNGLMPTFPNGMLRSLHGWGNVVDVVESTTHELEPAAEGGKMLRIKSSEMKDGQFIFVEYRRKRKQDAFLPDEGIAIYVVDLSIPNNNREDALAIELMQADNRRDLANVVNNRNRGDSDDLYPSLGNNTIGLGTKPELNLPGGTWSGVTITVQDITAPGAATMTVDIQVPARASARSWAF
jgi:immune inhibitor A